MWWKLLIFLAMTTVIIMAFVTPSPMSPGNALGAVDAYRIFYFHVPQSWVATLAFLISMYCSIQFLQNEEYGL